MNRFVFEENILRYERLLEKVSDLELRSRINELLCQERRALTDLKADGLRTGYKLGSLD